MVKKHRRLSTQQLVNLHNQTGTNISVRTMRRELLSMGLRSCVATRKPLVSAANRVKRLQFAKDHKNWTTEDWKNCHWSDESRFTLFCCDGRQRVRREPHEALDPKCMTATVQAAGGSVMVWGMFCWSGLGPLVTVHNTIKAVHYLELLDTHLMATMNHFHPEGNGIFQDDNARFTEPILSRNGLRIKKDASNTWIGHHKARI